ncbi:hypothetical protein [Caudoviricetes sp.]|nr:hypothetical protein [Caudoviricetes sp.]
MLNCTGNVRSRHARRTIARSSHRKFLKKI